VLHVIKGSSSDAFLSVEALTNRTIDVRLMQPLSGCAQTWHMRQVFRELMSEYILFLRMAPNTGDLFVSPRDESGVFRSPTGQISPHWDECRYGELLDQAWGRCDDCVDDNAVLIRVGMPVVTPDGCAVCSCVDRVIDCEPRFCDFHRAFIAAGVVLACALVICLVAFLYRRYRFRRLHARRAIVSVHNDTEPAHVPLEHDNAGAADDDDADGGGGVRGGKAIAMQGLVSRK